MEFYNYDDFLDLEYNYLIERKIKIKFSNYIANIADEKLDDEIVPDYFVENELRHWLNEKFFFDIL